MITPIRPEPPEQLALREARRLVARLLLTPESSHQTAQPKVALWKASLAAAWVVGISAFYLARMLGWI